MLILLKKNNLTFYLRAWASVLSFSLEVTLGDGLSDTNIDAWLARTSKPSHAFRISSPPGQNNHDAIA